MMGRVVRPSRGWRLLVAAIAVAAILVAGAAWLRDTGSGSSEDWRAEFGIPGRRLVSSGQAKYFILSPGFQLVLASRDAKLTITVLDETKQINGVETRVVEEREEANGELTEIARNFFAIDEVTGDVFYFGEDVDFYARGTIVGHSGTWLAYVNGSVPGLIMPGTPEVGMKYYQELAPGIAMDRAEVVSVSEACRTPAGEFASCLKTRESSKIEPRAIEYKLYAPGVGLVQDQSLQLVSYGYVRH